MTAASHAGVALDLLQHAEAQGLEPRDYKAEALLAAASRLSAAAAPAAGASADFELRLSGDGASRRSSPPVLTAFDRGKKGEASPELGRR